MPAVGPIKITLDAEEWKVISETLMAASYDLGKIFADKSVPQRVASAARDQAEEISKLSQVIYSRVYD